MANNKIIYNGNTLIDLTGDTAVAADVASGKTFHLADGTQATGTASGGGGDTIYDIYNTTGATYENNSMTTIPQYMFAYSKLATLTAPNVESVGAYGLSNSKITSLSLPVCTDIASSACMQCSSLTSIYLPEVLTLGANSFNFCSNLTSVSLPKATSVGYNSFSSNTKLEHASLPKITTVTSSCFQSCSRLLDVEVGPVTSVAASAFKSCSACLVFDFTRCTVVPTLANVSAFTGINANAQIKVPASLETNWKTANNWNTYASYIVGV